MNRLIAVACLLALAACASTPAPGPVTVQCLPMKPYLPAAADALAAQLTALKKADPTFADSPVAQAVTEYSDMRAADRACQAQTPPAAPQKGSP